VGCPKVSHSGGVTKHQIENLGGDPRVDLLDDGEIVLDPTKISWAGNGVGDDVV
jgi:hypothetical protein